MGTVVSVSGINMPYIDLLAEQRLHRDIIISETFATHGGSRACITGRLLMSQELPTSLPARAPSAPASPVLELNRVE